MLYTLPEDKTALEDHQAGWAGCKACPLHETRTNVCIGRGLLPADVVFIGEAPGADEDGSGYPFTGPSGALLDTILLQALSNFPAAEMPLYAVTNALGCTPYKTGFEEGGVREPKKEELEACLPRLEEFLSLAKPRAIVFVGAVAEAHVKPRLKVGDFYLLGDPAVLTITHPSSLLQKDSSVRAPLILQQVNRLESFLQRIFSHD